MNKSIVQLLCDLELVESRSMARRVIVMGAVRIDGEKIEDFKEMNVVAGTRVSVGKKEAVVGQ